MSTSWTRGVRRGALVTTLALLAPIGGVATATTLATAAPAGALPDCTKVWAAGVSGSWDTAANWSGGTVPSSADHVCLTSPGDYTVTLGGAGGSVTVASLRIGAPTGADGQTLAVTRGASNPADTLTATGGIETTVKGQLVLGQPHDSNLRVRVGVGAGAAITNAGTISAAQGAHQATLQGDVTSSGSLLVQDTLRLEGDLTTDGLVTIGSVLRATGTVWTRGGEIGAEATIVSEAGLRIGAAQTRHPGGSAQLIVEDGGALWIDDTTPAQVTTRGEVTLTGSSAPGQDIRVQGDGEVDGVLLFGGDFENRGRVELEANHAADAHLASLGSGTVINHGHLVRLYEGLGTASIDADLINHGTVATNDGRLDIDGDLDSDGDVVLGVGVLRTTGSVDLRHGGLLGVDVDAEADVAGRLDADGPVAVDGVLGVHTDGAPPVGTGPTVVEGGARTGTFDEVQLSGSASYDPAYLPTQVNLVRRASEPASQRFVRAVYQDFLGRQPTSQERTQTAAALDAGTLPRPTLVRQLSQTPEYVSALVQRFYVDTLGRPGEPDGVAYWVDQLRSGHRTVAQVAGSFYGSKEYFEKTGNNTSDWVFALYDVFFHRPPTADDDEYWTPRAQAIGRGRVAVELFQSLESRRQRVDRLYADLLGRDADAAGRDYWAARITKEGDLALAVFLASSTEYRDRAIVRHP